MPAGMREGCRTIHGGDFDIRAKGSLGDINIQIEQDIVIAAAEEFMRLDLDGDIQVAIRTAILTGLAFTSQADLGAGIDTGGISTTFRRDVRSRPRPWQVGQGLLMVSPSPRQAGQVVTCTIEPRIVWRTWRTSPVPLQVEQRVGVVPGLAPLPPQVLQSSSRVISISFSIPKTASSKVRSRRYCRSAPRRGALRERVDAAPEAAKTKQIAKDIGKIEIDSEIGSAAHAAHAGMSKAVIGGALFLVREHGVGFVDLFEALFGVRSFIHVRMVLACQLTEGSL